MTWSERTQTSELVGPSDSTARQRREVGLPEPCVWLPQSGDLALVGPFRQQNASLSGLWPETARVRIMARPALRGQNRPRVIWPPVVDEGPRIPHQPAYTTPNEATPASANRDRPGRSGTSPPSAVGTSPTPSGRMGKLATSVVGGSQWHRPQPSESHCGQVPYRQAVAPRLRTSFDTQ